MEKDSRIALHCVVLVCALGDLKVHWAVLKRTDIKTNHGLCEKVVAVHMEDNFIKAF